MTLEQHLPEICDVVIASVMAEVPTYRNGFDAASGSGVVLDSVRQSVRAFLGSVGGDGRDTGRSWSAPRAEAYELGRLQAVARQGVDDLLTAYRVGARAAWQHMSRHAQDHGMDAAKMAQFAADLFAYVDELSASSVAGHAEHNRTAQREAERAVERLAHAILVGAEPSVLRASATRAARSLPVTVTVVVVDEQDLTSVLSRCPSGALVDRDAPGTDLWGVVVPNLTATRREALVIGLAETAAVVGPTVPLEAAPLSLRLCCRARSATGASTDVELDLARTVVTADPEAGALLRDRVLAPLEALPPAKADKLAETLKWWMLLRGSRDAVARVLTVHPQTVGYRLSTARDLFGSALDDPEQVETLLIALCSRGWSER